jgi:hypothetical protein
MARDYDTQLLESVTVRRRRLRDAFLFGQLRSRRTLDENLVKILAGICVATVACAGSAGWSFIRQQRAVQQKQQNQLGLTTPYATHSATPSPTAVGAETWGGRSVTLSMLAAALRHVGTPDDLYSLPRVHQITSDDHYFLVKRSSRWIAGVTERGADRLGPRFTTEDAACRWLYNELVFAEPAPVTVSAGRARQRAAAVVHGVEAALHPVRPTPTPTPSGKKRAPKPKPPPTFVVIKLLSGFVVDQYGPESTSYLSPYGSAQHGEPHRFQVVKPLLVVASAAGTGVRLHVEGSLIRSHPELATVRWLLHNGYLRPATVG